MIRNSKQQRGSVPSDASDVYNSVDGGGDAWTPAPGFRTRNAQAKRAVPPEAEDEAMGVRDAVAPLKPGWKPRTDRSADPDKNSEPEVWRPDAAPLDALPSVAELREQREQRRRSRERRRRLRDLVGKGLQQRRRGDRGRAMPANLDDPNEVYEPEETLPEALLNPALARGRMTPAKAVVEADEDDDIDFTEAVFRLYALRRGLVGQRGPLDPVASANVAHDATLAYALPDTGALLKALPRVRALLAQGETEAEARIVDEAVAAAPGSALDDEAELAAALAALGDDYAVTGAEAARADDARGGVERAHGVRWLPEGNYGDDLAVAATLEHAAARCAAVAAAAGTPEAEKATLGALAASLKLHQLEFLYAAREAAAYEPELVACTRHKHDPERPLVTAPCAVVRGVLSYPVAGAGVRAVDAPLSTLAPPDDRATEDAAAKKAIAGTAIETARIRNEARRAEGGATPVVYAAPVLDSAVFAEPPTGAGLGEFEALSDEGVCEGLTAADFSTAMWRRIVRRALINVHAAEQGSAEKVDTLLQTLRAEGGAHVDAQERRSGLWTQFHRHVAISNDRLWVFVRTLSGTIGGDINEIITMADEQAMKATKELQEQRLAVAKRVADAQSKIVETIVGGMVRESKLVLSKSADGARANLVVVDAETRKELRSLASGESGKPFFEANVAMRNLQNTGDAGTPLPTLLAGIADVGQQIQRSLEASLFSTAGGTGTASLVELSHP